MKKVQQQTPPWLKPLLEATFFDECQAHGNAKNNQCKYYCLQCIGNPFCACCLDDHQKHPTIQIRRSSLSNGVKTRDIGEYINLCAIQTYVANGKDIVFLNARPYTGRPCGVINTCAICHRSLPTADFKFCCLSCKRDAIYRGFPEETFTVEPKLNTCELNDNFQVNQLLAPERQQKIRKLDILVSKSTVMATSIAKEIPVNVSPTTPPMFNHMNSRKRKGIPRRAPLT
ncbi:hypothetical protein RHSIM_Rhsim02G0185800 [Rhododendron simsii]|uniref:PLATZ transcription factor family protein n=1 Tax=Rhododendron simsii TaxID=118357 RepID=A0A834H8M6_RHOSS|nr:hypothetical protein RHSIM_Rhsim02G0185800 [Rhododendron simsii]